MLSLCVAVIVVLLVSAEPVRNHRPLEASGLVAAGGPHAVAVHRLQRRLRQSRPTGKQAGNTS
ncbi:hypothetical protein ACFSL4_21150 [Streptomyces caeni]|uniref:Secreted protein n=1 Tax=Streptomyces caeni TaxID=2307231 RepID=A0ABW4IU80_9ACTN